MMEPIGSRIKILVDYLRDYRVRILMYHSILNDSLDPWAVSPEEFEIQMNWLKKRGYNVLPLSQALSALRSKNICRKSIVLTFDDGLVDFLECAVPILRKYQFPATLFVVAGKIGGLSYWQSPELRRPLLDWNELRGIVRMGYEVGSHGLYHRDLTALCSKDLETEVSISKKLIEDNIGAAISAFSYPWGFHSLREESAVQGAGYDCAVAVGSKWGNGSETNCFCFGRETMCRTDSLPDFARKVCGHDQFFIEAKQHFSHLWKRRVQWRIP